MVCLDLLYDREPCTFLGWCRETNPQSILLQVFGNTGPATLFVIVTLLLSDILMSIDMDSPVSSFVVALVIVFGTNERTLVALVATSFLVVDAFGRMKVETCLLFVTRSLLKLTTKRFISRIGQAGCCLFTIRIAGFALRRE